jgi:hypothetical protein
MSSRVAQAWGTLLSDEGQERSDIINVPDDFQQKKI